MLPEALPQADLSWPVGPNHKGFILDLWIHATLQFLDFLRTSFRTEPFTAPKVCNSDTETHNCDRFLRSGCRTDDCFLRAIADNGRQDTRQIRQDRAPERSRLISL